MKKILILAGLTLGLILFFFSCDYPLWMLKSRKMDFEELPIEVKKKLPKMLLYIDDILFCVNPKDTSIYQLESVPSMIVNSWVSHYKLIDMKKNIHYHISRNKRTFIIYNENLYIPDRILYDSVDVRYATYTEYELK